MSASPVSERDVVVDDVIERALGSRVVFVVGVLAALYYLLWSGAARDAFGAFDQISDYVAEVAWISPVNDFEERSVVGAAAAVLAALAAERHDWE